jgi:hypothetical protein
MATADSILTEVYRIVRDPSRTATTEAVALKMLSHAQRALNTYSRSAVSEVTLATTGGVALYATPTTLSRVDLVREGTKDLVKFRLSQLWARDKNWLTTQGTSFILWSRIGRQVLAIVPPKAGVSAVTLVGPTNLADLAAIGTSLTVRDDQLETLAEMTEALFTLRLRLFPAFQAVMERLGQKFSIAPTKLFGPGLQSVDSSERAAGVAPGDIPDLDERTRQVAQQRLGPGGGQIA